MREGAADGGRIEFLTPRDSIFGGDSPLDFSGIDVDDRRADDDVAPRPRWLTGAAVLAVIGLVGGGVLAAAPWSGDGATPSQPDVSVSNSPPVDAADAELDAGVATSTPSVIDAAGPSVRPLTGFVFDPLPPGFAIQDAYSVASDQDGNEARSSGWGEVWATDTATRSSGSWFSVTLLPFDSSPFESLDLGAAATRVDLGGRFGIVRDLGDGVLQMTIPLSHSGRQQTMVVRTFGRSLDAMVALTSSIGVEQDHPQLVDDRPVYLDQSQLDGYELVASGATDRDLLDAYHVGPTNASTFYETGDADSYIAIQVSPRDTSLESLGRLAVGPVRIFPDSGSVSSDFTGADLVLGVSPSGSNPNIIARWHADDTTVSVRTTMPLGDLLALLPTVRHTTAREWSVVRRRVDNTQTSGSSAASGVPASGIPVGGSTSDGRKWSALFQPPDGAQLWFGDRTATADGLSSEQSIAVGSFDRGTVAMALDAPGAHAMPAASMRVRIGGQIVMEAAMIDIGQLDPTSSFAGRVGALMFDQTGPFDIEVVADDGTLLDHAASPGYVP